MPPAAPRPAQLRERLAVERLRPAASSPVAVVVTANVTLRSSWGRILGARRRHSSVMADAFPAGEPSTALNSSIRAVLIAAFQDDEARAAVVRRVGKDLHEEVLLRGAALQDDLRNRIEDGYIPSFISLCGAADLEKPFNRLLGWWATESADHGCGRKFLIELTHLLGPIVLEEDLREGRPVNVLVEEAVGAEAREPDLLVWSDRGILLLENKVLSPESGEGQYADYLALLDRLANGRDRRAVLAARTVRDAPPGWDRFVSHGELATAFDRLAGAPEVPTWGRITAAITAHTLRAPNTSAIMHTATHLAAKPPAQLTVYDCLSMEQVLEQLGSSATPWSAT